MNGEKYVYCPRNSTLSPEFDGEHGRIEGREVVASEDIGWLRERHDWRGLRSIIMILSSRETAKGQETEKRFYISSLPADAEKPGAAIRAHWGVENSLHWVLDVNFRDDDCRIRKKNAPANFTAVKRATINALRKAPGKDKPQIQAPHRRMGRGIPRKNPRRPMTSTHSIPLLSP